MDEIDQLTQPPVASGSGLGSQKTLVIDAEEKKILKMNFQRQSTFISGENSPSRKGSSDKTRQLIPSGSFASLGFGQTTQI